VGGGGHPRQPNNSRWSLRKVSALAFTLRPLSTACNSLALISAFRWVHLRAHSVKHARSLLQRRRRCCSGAAVGARIGCNSMLHNAFGTFLHIIRKAHKNHFAFKRLCTERASCRPLKPKRSSARAHRVAGGDCRRCITCLRDVAAAACDNENRSRAGACVCRKSARGVTRQLEGCATPAKTKISFGQIKFTEVKMCSKSVELSK
jgi:hypothetical protein